MRSERMEWVSSIQRLFRRASKQLHSEGNRDDGSVRNPHIVPVGVLGALRYVGGRRYRSRCRCDDARHPAARVRQNVGQSHPRVHFVARGAGFEAFLTDEGANVVLTHRAGKPASMIQIRPSKSRKDAMPKAEDPLIGTANYFYGVDPSDCVIDAKTFARVRYESIHPGIDLVFYGTQHALEYDVVVRPGADPRTIDLQISGVEQLKLAADGSLQLFTPSGQIDFRKPVAYQRIDGKRRDVDARYVLRDRKRIGFRVGRYDAHFPLIIDPILSVSTNVWGA